MNQDPSKEELKTIKNLREFEDLAVMLREECEKADEGEITGGASIAENQRHILSATSSK